MSSPDQNIASGKSPAEDVWYYADKSGPVGPLSLQELRETLATLSNDSAHPVLVWRQGFANWKPATDVSQLNGGETLLPPPLPGMGTVETDPGMQGAAVPRKVTLTGLSPLLVLALIAFGGWAYFGFPSPDTLLQWPSAAEECVKFAEKHKEQLFFGSKNIRAESSWLKHGKIVVEIGAFENDSDTTYTPRICVIGGGTIQIVSILENNAWR